MESAKLAVAKKNRLLENIARCKAYKALKEKPPIEGVSLATHLHHSRPVPLAISLLDLTTNTAAPENAAGEEQHAIPGNTLRLTERQAHRFNRIG